MFRPVKEAHAIAEMVVFVQTARPLDASVLERLRKLEKSLRRELPRFELMQRLTGEISFDPRQSPSTEVSATPGGMLLQRIAPNGEVEWALRIMDNVIAVHCADYTRWETVWSKTKKFLLEAFAHVRFQDNPIVSMGLKYLDSFIFERAGAAYDASQLFRKDTKYIAPISFESGELWHSHSGWFDDFEGKFKANCLNQLNIGTKQEGFDLSTIIEHNAILQFSIPQTNPVRQIDGKGPLVDRVMVELHEANKRLLAALLTDQVCKRIRLIDSPIAD